MAVEVRTLAVTYYAGHHIEPHAHPWGQLIYAAEGMMRVRAADELWMVPPQRAVWAPPGTLHEIHGRGTFAMRTLYLSPRLSALLEPTCRALEVDAFLRELVLHVVGSGMLDCAKPEQRRLAAVLVDRLSAASVLPLSIKLPQDRRARSVAEWLQKHPGDAAELRELAARAGASARTLQRLFRLETGLGFSAWRQRLRLLHAVASLNDGSSVTEAAADAGYATPSAFIAMFRRQLGVTPLRYRSRASSTASTASSISSPASSKEP